MSDATALRILLGADPLLMPLTGIGRYTHELVDGLRGHAAIDELRLFAHGRVLAPDAFSATTSSDADAIPAPPPPARRALARVRSVLARSRLAVRVYERLSPLVLERGARRLASRYIFHSPNFVVPAGWERSVVTFHDLSTRLMPQFHPTARVEFINRAMDTAVSDGAHVITDSDYVRRQILEHFSLPAHRCSAIGLGADASFAPRTREECEFALAARGLVHDEYFLFVSTIEPRKNILRLCEAYETAMADAQHPLPLVVVGDAGWHSEREHEALQRLVSRGLATYLGYVPQDEMPLLFAGARGLLFPSLYEGFGLPVLEAMQSGTAVLTSQDSAMSEICGDAAVLVDPLDTDTLVDGLRTLAEDAPLRARLAQAGLQRAAGYSWRRCVEETIAVYRSLP